MGMEVQGPVWTSPVALEGTSPSLQGMGQPGDQTALFPLLERNKIFFFFFWQNLLYQTTFFEARNILTFLFAFFDERTKLKALHFSIFFAAWAFQKWEIRSNICSLQRDLALLILHVTNRRDRCSLASSESLSLGYS